MIHDSVARKPHQDVVTEQSKKAILLYGHPFVAARFIASDLERAIEDEWEPLYKREPQDLIGIIEEMKRQSIYGSISPIKPLILAAMGLEKEFVEIPIVENPIPQTNVEKAFNDYLEGNIQIKQGRWRLHIRDRWKKGWITTLCDYDKDKELRDKYPLASTASYFPIEFQQDARAWRNDYRKPQEEKRKTAIKANFGMVDEAIERFKNYVESTKTAKT